jgi:putative tricarboxylic transport membrane protein
MGIALIVLYVLVTPWAGFAVTTVAFIAAFMTLAGARSPVSIGANAVLGTVVLLYAFVKVVYLPLPKGEGGFEALTLLVYRALRIF